MESALARLVMGREYFRLAPCRLDRTRSSSSPKASHFTARTQSRSPRGSLNSLIFLWKSKRRKRKLRYKTKERNSTSVPHQPQARSSSKERTWRRCPTIPTNFSPNCRRWRGLQRDRAEGKFILTAL